MCVHIRRTAHRDVCTHKAHNIWGRSPWRCRSLICCKYAFSWKYLNAMLLVIKYAHKSYKEQKEYPWTNYLTTPKTLGYNTSLPYCTSSVVLVAQSCLTLCDPMDCSLPGFSMGFSRQEYWSGLPFPSPGDLPNPATELGAPVLQADSLLSEEFFTELKILLLHLRSPYFPLNSLKQELCCMHCCIPSI